MIGNKNSHKLIAFAVLMLVLAVPAQVLAVDTATKFSVTTFDLEAKKSEEELARERKKNSPLNQDLIYRVAFGREPDVRVLLSQEADPNAQNEAKMPVLMTALIRKDEESPKITRTLLEFGANVNTQAPDGNMVITEAVRGGLPEVVKILIEYNAVLMNIVDERGRDLIKLAEARGDAEIIRMVTAKIEAEKAHLAALRSTENFIKLIQDYAFLSCANEYLNYYISTKPEGVDIVRFNDIIGQNAKEIEDSHKKIVSIFNMSKPELRKIAVTARKEIYLKLESYETNQNRKLNGVGQDVDLNGRCWKIAKKWNSRNMSNQYKLNLQN